MKSGRLFGIALVALLAGGCGAGQTSLTLAPSQSPNKDGEGVSLKLVAKSGFPSGTLHSEHMYSLTYWSRGTQVQGYVAVPPGNGPFPLVTILHGGEMFGGHAIGAPYHDNSFPAWNLSRAEAVTYLNHAVVFMPNYRGWGQSHGTVVDTYGDSLDAINGLKALADVRGLRLNRDVYLEGSSTGGDVALLLASKLPGVRAVFLWSPYPGAQQTASWLMEQPQNRLSTNDVGMLADFIRLFGDNLSASGYRENSPNYKDIQTPVLIVAGNNDPYYPVALMRKLYSDLRAHDNSVELRVFSGGHAPDSPEAQKAAYTWMRKHFKGAFVTNPS